MNEPEKENHGDCDICGEYSTMLVGGVCQKSVCQRHVEEGKHDLCGKAWMNGEYVGQGGK